MIKFLKIFSGKGSTLAYSITTAIFTFFPESCFNNKLCVLRKLSDEMTITISRLIIFIVIFFISNVIYLFYQCLRTKVFINGNNFSIQIEYGDLFQISKGKIVIDFDECFTTTVGENPAEIKPTSVCGQYLVRYPIYNIQDLIEKAGVKSSRKKSKYNNQNSYSSGTIVPNDNFLLMAFAKLDENGLGCLSYDEYIDCLEKLWEQIDIWHGTSDVYVPILGSKIVRFDKDLTQQELLDIMISSYRLSPKKMNKSYTLHIVCRKQNGFSLNKIFGIK